MRRRLVLVAIGAGVALLAVFALATSGNASSNERVIKVRDNCDPVTFNLPPPDGPGPDICFRDPDTSEGNRVTFPRFIGDLFAADPSDILQARDHLGWRFGPDETGLRSGETLLAQNEGGEFHTFTEVTGFTGGCIPPLNAPFGLTPGPQCADGNTNGVPDTFETDGVAPAGFPGDMKLVAGLSAGTHLFQCFIHPWMRTVVDVE